MSYPKPAGWDGGPDGDMMRQGSAGRLGWNPNTDNAGATPDRRNLSDDDDFTGICYEYGDA